MLHIFVRDDLVKIGVTEDGEDDIASRFYVVVETPDGRRFAHDRGFMDVEPRFDPVEGRYLQRVQLASPEAQAEALRAKIERHLKAGGKLDDAHWNEVDPCYGSEAYATLDAMSYFKGRERQEARDAGENVPLDFAQDWGFQGGPGLAPISVSDL